MAKPTLHVLGLPHTQTVRDGYETCAYTTKIVRFCDMMAGTHKIVLYSGDRNDAACSEHVALFTEEERAEFFGDRFDTVETPLEWNAQRPYWSRFAERALVALKDRAAPKDLLLLTTSTQTPISDAAGLLAFEWTVGYEGVRLPFCVFESHAWRHHVYGLGQIRNGRAFDAVIPNFFDENDFTPRYRGNGGGYLLYLGRLIQRKGPHVAALIAARLGMKLLVAGPGALAWETGKVVCSDGTVLEAPRLEYVGILSRHERAQVLSEACALLVPTLYIEPFGGVAVEAMLSGTPVVASDWGAFTETVEEGVTGYRFSTLAQAAEGAVGSMALDRAVVRSHAAARFSLPVVARRYDAYVDRLMTLYGEGWYA